MRRDPARNSRVWPAILLAMLLLTGCVSTQGGLRERECEDANQACSLSCGTPDVLERRLDEARRPAYIGTYVRCTAACNKKYAACLERLVPFERGAENSDTFKSRD